MPRQPQRQAPPRNPGRRLVALLATAGLALAGWLAWGGVAHADSVLTLKRRLREAMEEGNDREAARVAQELAKDGSRSAVYALLEGAAETASDPLYRTIVLLTAKLGGEEATDAIIGRLTGSGAVELRIVAAVVCANRDDDATLEALIEVLPTRRDTLRRMVTRALVSRRDKRAVPPLIDLLERQEGKPGGGAGLIARALRELTGKGFTAAATWRSFWEAHGADFELPEASEAREALVPEGDDATAARFFGRELDSDRIVFVIDVSGSMSVADRRSEERPETGQSPYATDSRVRIERAKAELMQAVASLPRSASFTVIAYSGYPPPGTLTRPDDPDAGNWLQTLSPRLVRATSRNVERAAEFVERLRAAGSTFTGRAIEAALTIDDADLIVLLSDGAPTEWTDEGGSPRGLSVSEVRQRIRTANRYRRVTIDSFGFEGSGDVGWVVAQDPAEFIDFMKGVARDSGGIYQAID